jgi:hypothetical protein
MNDDEMIEKRLQKFGAAVQAAAEKKHKMTDRQVEFFKNAIREQAQQQGPAENAGPANIGQSVSHEKSITKSSTEGHNKTTTKSATHGHESSEGHGHSH